jgi:preprotein translocase subunit SecD
MSLTDPRVLWPAGLALVLFAGQFFTARRPERARHRARLAVALLVIAGLGFYLTTINPVMAHIKQGLDLQGGVHVVLEAQDLPDAPVTEEAMRTVEAILIARVNGLGVAEPRVEREGARRVVVELPGIADPERAMADIGRTAFLEFAESFDLYLLSTGPSPDAVETVLRDELGLTAAKARAIVAALPAGEQRIGAALEYVDVFEVSEALFEAGAEVRAKPRTVLTGRDLKPGSARAVFDQNNRPAVSLTFAGEPAARFADLTTRRLGWPVYILLDGQLVQAPQVSEPITTGQAQITGYASLDEAFRVAVILNSGALPVRLVALAPQVVSATLGADSVARSKTAGLVAVCAVVGFMLLFYRAAGLLANIALAVYIMLVLGILAGLNATLTLPGIAGLLLSVGMAVDANVITFERIREEMQLGKSIRSAIESGYTLALRSIVDANLTTLIAGGVLFYLGTGPIRGFAVTLVVGIASSMFTAVYVTRYLMRLAARAGLLANQRLLFGYRMLGGEQGA